MSNVPVVPAREAEPRGEMRPGRECFADGVGFGEGWQSLKGKNLLSHVIRENCNAFAMERNELRMGAVVVAVILRAVVQGRAIGPERDCDLDVLFRKPGGCFPCERKGLQQCGIGAFRGEAALKITHARNLVAGGFDALCAGGKVRAVYGENLFRGVLEHMGRPKRPIDLGTEIFQFRGQATIEHSNALEERNRSVVRIIRRPICRHPN